MYSFQNMQLARGQRLAFCTKYLSGRTTECREPRHYREFGNDASHKTLKGEIKRGKQCEAFSVSD